jgi:hypothetical protein
VGANRILTAIEFDGIGLFQSFVILKQPSFYIFKNAKKLAKDFALW